MSPSNENAQLVTSPPFRRRKPLRKPAEAGLTPGTRWTIPSSSSYSRKKRKERNSDPLFWGCAYGHGHELSPSKARFHFELDGLGDVPFYGDNNDGGSSFGIIRTH